jgi:ribosome-associated protein
MMAQMEEHDFISKTRRKTAMLDLQALGEELLTLSADRLASLHLPENLLQAIGEAKRINKHGALKRQRQYIGRLMRDIDPGPIRSALDGWRHQSGAAVAVQHRAERWRERLIDNDHEFTAFAGEFPRADLPRLRQLARHAREERVAQKPPRAFRELYRALHEQFAQQPNDPQGRSLSSEQDTTP